MSVHKRATNKNKTNIHWGFAVRIKTGQFDYFGNPVYKQVAKWGFQAKKEAQQAEREFLNNFQCNKIELDKNATFEDVFYFLLILQKKKVIIRLEQSKITEHYIKIILNTLSRLRLKKLLQR